MERADKWLIAGIAVVVGFVMVFGSFKIVPPGHRGIAVTLGRVQENYRHEGITFKLPLVTKIICMPIKQITIESTAPCFSSDLQTVKVKYNVLYRLPENEIVGLYQKYSGDPYTTLVEPRAQEILKQLSATYRAEEMVKAREAIKALAVPKLQAAVGDLVFIVDVVINNVDLTNELEKAIEQKQVMEQQALAKVYELQKAQKEAEITIVQAKAEAESVRIKGEALKASPEVIQLEIAKKWDGKTPTYVSTTAGGANVLLPLK